ncbi:MAG TPA: hypothetical protein QF626_01060 [Prochlorococcaceae cyanobacterium Fu_MAG_50]|nr:hypothetical protein [Prochlorococcaceae cyanobacterium Fu_MAG_50]
MIEPAGPVEELVDNRLPINSTLPPGASTNRLRSIEISIPSSKILGLAGSPRSAR